jgi:hypothetical protein
MKDLLIHVEKIVRPVRAIAPRKLRMRRELLAHLQAALEEERGRDGDEVSALARAKVRLGEPSELTRGLQASVPWIERMLLARLPLPAAAERMEKYSGRWWKLDCPMTMTQASILVAGSTMLPFIALMGLVMGLHLDREEAQRLMVERPPTWVILNLGSIAVVLALSMICARWIIAVASSTKPWRSPAAIGPAASIIVLPAASIVLTVACLNRRVATVGELFWSLGMGLLLMLSQAIIGRLVATLRQPYAEWLTLDIAG